MSRLRDITHLHLVVKMQKMQTCSISAIAELRIRKTISLILVHPTLAPLTDFTVFLGQVSCIAITFGSVAGKRSWTYQ